MPRKTKIIHEKVVSIEKGKKIKKTPPTASVIAKNAKFKRTRRVTRAVAIKKHCLECSGGSYKERKLCPLTECWLYPYRLGSEKKAKELEAKNEQ